MTTRDPAGRSLVDAVSTSQNASVVAASNDKENQQQSLDRNMSSDPVKERSQLQKMGALMDQEDNGVDNRTDQENSTTQNRSNSNSDTGQQSIESDEAKTQQNNSNSAALCTTTTAVQRRRRLAASGQIAASILTPHSNNGNSNSNSNNNNNNWEGFVRKGTRLKSFLDDAMQQVATGYAITNGTGTKRQRLVATNDDENTTTTEDADANYDMEQSNDGQEREQAASAVAKEKTSEVLLLKQKLQEAQTQVASLTASNDTLREESQASSLRFERTIEALKIAAANAASARTDADQAEASSEGLSTQLEALQIVVQETKQASLLLYEEQQEIAEQARTAQAKLLQTEANLARSLKETKQLRDQTQEWQDKAKQLQEETTTIKRQLTDQTEETRKLNQALAERDALDKARKERSQQIEQELRDAQALLVSATSAAAETETMEVLKDSILELQAANKKLHEQLYEQQETGREEKQRLQESLLQAEKEAQVLRIEASLHDEQQKSAASKDTNVDNDNDNDNNNSSNNNKTVSPEAASDTSFTISRPAASPTLPPAATCIICFKKACGMMKNCQCGDKNCKLRAHINCAKKLNPGPSVSHPGTPGAKLPIILCAGPLAHLQPKDYD